MPSVLAIVSKRAFDKAHRHAKPGDVLPIERYESRHARLDALAGGALFLVTVRPADRLWLVAVLEQPVREDHAWRARPNTVPILDITDRLDRLVFSTGHGLTGALAQALQTPRLLTSSDEDVLRGTDAPMATELTEEQLVALVLEDPDDVAPRLVYADWLLERGDVRGELLRRALDGADEDAQVRDWLGPLARVTTSRVWRHGVLDSFELGREELADSDVWQRAAESPWLRTVRQIQRGRATWTRYRAFALSPLAQGLEEVTVDSKAALVRLCARPRPALRRLILDKPSPAMRDVLATTEALPGLLQLTLRSSDMPAVVAQWLEFRPAFEVMPSAPIFLDSGGGRDREVRQVFVQWLRARGDAVVEHRHHDHRLSTYRLRAGALHVITDRLSTDEVTLATAVAPTKLILEPRNVDQPHLRGLLDDSQNWTWINGAVRELLRRLGPDRLELRGAYAALAPLARG